MILELGNPAARMADGSPAGLGAPSVTTIHIPDSYFPNSDVSLDPDAVNAALSRADRIGGITRDIPEAILAVIHSGGAWRLHSTAPPSWIDSQDVKGKQVAAHLAAMFGGTPLGRPADVEDTYFTQAGPPGVVPGANLDLNALLVNSGRDMWARNLGGQQVGVASTSTGTSSSTLSDTLQAWTVNQWIGAVVYCGGVFGVVQSNTSTALTIDRWSNPATPGGAAGSTPGATTAYIVGTGGAPAWFVGLGNTNTAPVATDTSMSGEIVTAGGGLVRKIAPWAHTAGTNTYTLTPVYTANGTDSLPVTVYRIGVFASMVVAATASTMMFETLLSASATLSSSGDQLTCFSAETPILTERGEVPIADVVVGDLVLTHEGRYLPVVRSWRTGEAETVRVSGGDRSIRCTPEHRVLAAEITSEGKLGAPAWTRADDLVGLAWATPRDLAASDMDSVKVDADYVWTRVTRVELDEEIVPVFDLEVEGDHSFVASGVCVHNCSEVVTGS